MRVGVQKRRLRLRSHGCRKETRGFGRCCRSGAEGAVKLARGNRKLVITRAWETLLALRVRSRRKLSCIAIMLQESITGLSLRVILQGTLRFCWHLTSRDATR